MTPPIVVEKKWYQKRWVRASAVATVIGVAASILIVTRGDRMLPPLDGDIKPQ